MKTLAGILCLSMLATTPAAAQIDSSVNKSFCVGISAGEFGYDAGVSLEVATPAFFEDRLLLRMKGSMAWLEAHKAAYDKWATYKTMNVSLVYNFIVIERARPYAEIGASLIMPGKKFSNEGAAPGGTCAIGAELFVISRADFSMCYYFSGGITYAQAYAEKIEGKPRYSNGFLFSNGLRFYF